MIKHVLLICSLMVSGVASSEVIDKWVNVSGEGNPEIFVNPSRMRVIDKSNQIIDIWEKIVFIRPETIANIKHDKNDYYLLNKKYRCLDRQGKKIMIAFYQSDKLISRTDTSDETWKIVIPDSIEEEVLIKVCKYLITQTS